MAPNLRSEKKGDMTKDSPTSESNVDAALRYLREHAEEAAQARAEVRYLAEYLKSKRSALKLLQAGLSNAAAEDAAMAHPEYLALLEGYKVAVENDARHSFKREAAQALIEAWRTRCASARAEGKAYS